MLMVQTELALSQHALDGLYMARNPISPFPTATAQSHLNALVMQSAAEGLWSGLVPPGQEIRRLLWRGLQHHHRLLVIRI